MGRTLPISATALSRRRRRPDRNDAPTGMPYLRDTSDGLGRNHTPFGFHLVVARVDGLE
jgi:hypothetical protein